MYFYIFWWPHPGIDFTQGFILLRNHCWPIWGPYGMQEMGPRLAACKALSAVLLYYSGT